MSGSLKTVLVTGSTGFIGTNLVLQMMSIVYIVQKQ